MKVLSRFFCFQDFFSTLTGGGGGGGRGQVGLCYAILVLRGAACEVIICPNPSDQGCSYIL